MVTATPDSTASRCLRHEGVRHYEIVHTDDGHYGRVIADHWERGEPFIVVEHDICPWPGAIGALIDCSHSWCGFPTVRWETPAVGMACVKITPEGEPPQPSDWQQVDGHTIARLSELYAEQHMHSPPVAHARVW